MKVRIKSLGLPKAAYGQQVDYGLSLGRTTQDDSSNSLRPKRTISGVPRSEANLEAEGGESVVGQISGDGIVDHMAIKGPRHSSGGVPMNLPDDSFIFSDTKSMKIRDPKILQMFGKKKGSYTPAELAKPYDISKYKAILMDPNTDRLSRTTAEIMIKNIVMKLGALALAQESKKGFPQGIPEISKPYMQANGIREEDLIPELKAQAEQMQQQAMQMQQMQQQQMMQQQQAPQGSPQRMPDGQPVAMPQQGMAPPEQPMMDPRQMMAMQQEQQMMPPQPQQGAPMARYGMQLGGYDMPFVMANGGLTKYQTAGETVEEIEGTEVDDFSGEGRDTKSDQSGHDARIYENEAENRGYDAPTNVTTFATDVCAEIRKGRNGRAFSKQEAIDVRMVHPDRADEFEHCYRKGDKTAEYKVKVVEKEDTCVCADKDENPLPGAVVMSYEEILASGKIEGYTIEQGCDGFTEAFCREEVIEEQIQEAEKMPMLPLTEISMRRGVADPIKTGLDIVPTGETSYLDYRTAVQNDANARQEQIQSINNMPGLTVGQKQAMIAKVNSTDKSAAIVTDVYNKNVQLDAKRSQLDQASAMRQQQLQAGLDADYNRADKIARDQKTINNNAAKMNRQKRADDMYKMAIMKQSVEAGLENFDMLGNFVNGTPSQKEAMYFACLQKFGPEQCEAFNPNNVANTTNSTVPMGQGQGQANEDRAQAQQENAKYGRIVNPYIMASSVYPWST